MKKVLLLTAFLFVASLGFSQYKWDFGAHIGAANYLGEIGGKEKTRRGFILDMKLSQTRTALGGFARYKLNPDIYLRANVGWYRVSGADSLSTNPGRAGRNLSFRNDLFEATITGQYVFYNIADLGRSYRYQNDMKAYVFTGIGTLYHSPHAKYNGEWVALQPLHTEGQGVDPNAPEPYSKITMVLPAGAGIFFTIGKKLRVGWEFNWRTTFTDYLDDASTVYTDPANLPNETAVALANRNDELTYVEGSNLPSPKSYDPGTKRGDPKHNDSYLSTGFNVSYVIKGTSKFAHSKYNSFFGKKFKGRTIRAKF